MIAHKLISGLPLHRRMWMTACLCLAVLALMSAPVVAQARARIVAVGDVHGDVDALVSILQAAEVIDGNRQWRGGATTLVQVGDMLDRGLKGREVMDLYMSLEQQAPQAGGRVVVLLGNHEVMNITGDLRYVVNYSPFADAQADERRKTAYQTYKEWQAQRAATRGNPAPVFTPDDEEKWMKNHYRGFVEREEALGPDGKYGAWLRTLPTVAQIDSYIFLHGGISPQMSEFSVNELNQQIAEDITRFDRYKQYMVENGIILRFLTIDEMMVAARDEKKALQAKSDLSEQEAKRLEVVKAFIGYNDWTIRRQDGPLWFRGYEKWSDTEGIEHVAALREAYGDVRFVVGHSTTKDRRIHTRFDNAVFIIDTGMSAMYYRGRPSALEINHGGIAAVYKESRETFVEPTGGMASTNGQTEQTSAAPMPEPRFWWGPDGPLPFKTDAEIIEFMRTAEVVSVVDIPEGVTKPKKVMLEKDGIRMNVAFRYVSKVERDIAIQPVRDDCIFEPAAYVLSQVLGFNSVPPSIPRKIKGRDGTVQIWIENSIMEKDRRKKDIAPFDSKRWAQDWKMIEVFDNLIYNDDRNSGNIVYDQTFTTWLIDHTRAFRLYTELRDTHTEYLKQCERDVWEKLQTIDDETIKQQLDPYLEVYEIEALLKRRQKLVAYIQQLIDKNGEDEVLFTW